MDEDREELLNQEAAPKSAPAYTSRGQQRRRLAEPPGIPMYHTPHILRVPVWDIPMSARPLLCRGTQKMGRRTFAASLGDD